MPTLANALFWLIYSFSNVKDTNIAQYYTNVSGFMIKNIFIISTFGIKTKNYALNIFTILFL